MLEAAAVLDPDVWPTDQVELSTQGNVEVLVLADYCKDNLAIVNNRS